MNEFEWFESEWIGLISSEVSWIELSWVKNDGRLWNEKRL